MTFKKLIPAAIMAITATAANAGGFDGPFVQLGVGGSGTWTKVSNSPETEVGSNINGTTSGGSVNGIILGGYSQDLGIIDPSIKGLNLAANIFYVIGNQSSGSKTSSATQDGFTQNLSLNGAKLQNTFGISVEPGWNFTESALGYFKFAWLNSRVQGTVGYSDSGGDGNSTSFNLNGPSSTTINGFGYGIGGKYLITKNIFAGVDLMGVTYSGVSPTYSVPSQYGGDTVNPSQKVSQFMGFASIGYKF